jgi:hypothetical protein
MVTETYTVAEVFAIGMEHGRSLYDHNIRDVKDYHEVRDGEIDMDDFDLSEFEDNVRTVCWEADEGYRQYSPFEFFCKALNEDENADELWESYEQGINEGVEDELTNLTKQYYMTAEEAHKVVEQWLENKDA